MKKAEALLAYPVPVNRKQLQSFLGLARDYRKFVPNYAQMSDLLKKERFSVDSGSRQSFSRSEVEFGHTTSVATTGLFKTALSRGGRV